MEAVQQISFLAGRVYSFLTKVVQSRAQGTAGMTMWITCVAGMGVGRIFFQEGHWGIFPKFFQGGPKVVKFVFSHSKSRNQPFLLKFLKSRWGPCHPPAPSSDAHGSKLQVLDAMIRLRFNRDSFCSFFCRIGRERFCGGNRHSFQRCEKLISNSSISVTLVLEVKVTLYWSDWLKAIVLDCWMPISKDSVTFSLIRC